MESLRVPGGGWLVFLLAVGIVGTIAFYSAGVPCMMGKQAVYDRHTTTLNLLNSFAGPVTFSCGTMRSPFEVPVYVMFRNPFNNGTESARYDVGVNGIRAADQNARVIDAGATSATLLAAQLGIVQAGNASSPSTTQQTIGGLLRRILGGR